MKIQFYLFFILFVCFGSLNAKNKQTICLNMIVKNESAVIERCLKTVKPLIDYWVIVDTGSTDGTQKIIKEYLKDIPGELHERPWENFAYNRNEALELAKDKADYILRIDADEQLIFSDDFALPYLDKDFYYILTEHSGSNYYRNQLFNNALNWRWVGVLHEVLQCSQAKTHAVLKGVKNLYGFDGCRSQDPQKFQKDALILEEALKKEPNNSRYVFYLAQSYKDANNYKLAIKNYQKRAEMGGWQEEIFSSLFQIGLLQEASQEDPQIFCKSYYKAFHCSPSHIEPLYRLANYYRRDENYLMGYLLSKYALSLPCPTDALFVEKWIYDYGMLMELSLCAYYLGKYEEAKKASDKLLATPILPQDIRECAIKNAVWFDSKSLETQTKSQGTAA